MSVYRDSSVYQNIVDEGQTMALHDILLRLGKMRFGPPEEATLAALKAITDLDRLKRLSERLLDVSSWKELLATP